MAKLTPAAVSDLTVNMLPTEAEVVVLVFVRTESGRYIRTAPITLMWPEMMALQSTVKNLVKPGEE